MIKVAIQGIEGSFHDIAAHRFFEGEEIELVCCQTFPELFRQIRQDSSVLGMMAIENTIAGSLLPNYELLRQSGCRIIGEHKLHIEHSLLCLPDDERADLREVNSHPVALAQCRSYLEAHPTLKVVETDDTAGAAADIARQGLHGHAAICHADAARLYGMKVLEQGIEDNKHNYTRFLALCDRYSDFSFSRPQATASGERLGKASIVFALPHEEGSLSHILSILSYYHINLSKIQSLPIVGREWEYLFYVDVLYTDALRYRQSIDAVRPLLKELTILGEYEAC